MPFKGICNIRVTVRLVCAVVLASVARAAAAQVAAGATEFWLAPPDITDLHNPPGGEPIYLVLMSSDVASSVTVTIDQPANGSFTPIVVTLPANDSSRVNLTPFKASLETRPTNTITPTGLHIVATAPIGAYYEIANTSNGDMLTLKGPDALGQEFYIPLQKNLAFGNDSSYPAPHQAFASFDIVASQNNTVVSIYSPVPVDGYAALQVFTVNLNRGQAYSGGYTGTNWSVPSMHPSGAVVLADKPVGVSIKDDSVHNPSGACTDLLSDQLVPVSALGMDYIAVKGALNSTGNEGVVVMAARNNTQIFLNGAAAPATTLFAGEYYSVSMDYLAAGPDNAVYIHASQPVYAAHISGIGCEMGMALLPRLDVGGSQRVDFVRDDTQTFYLMLVSPAAAVNAFTLTGAGTAAIDPAAFLPVPGTGGAWMAARIQYDTTQVPVDTAFHVSNSAGYFALGVLSGDTASARYGYLSDFAASIGIAVTALASPATLPAPGGVVTLSVHVANSGETAATLTSLSDSFQGDLAGRGNCAVPQTIAAGASYDCSFSLNVSGNAGDVATETIVASGISHATSVAASGSATVTFDDIIFADGFQ